MNLRLHSSQKIRPYKNRNRNHHDSFTRSTFRTCQIPRPLHWGICFYEPVSSRIRCHSVLLSIQRHSVETCSREAGYLCRRTTILEGTHGLTYYWGVNYRTLRKLIGFRRKKEKCKEQLLQFKYENLREYKSLLAGLDILPTGFVAPLLWIISLRNLCSIDTHIDGYISRLNPRCPWNNFLVVKICPFSPLGLPGKWLK